MSTVRTVDQPDRSRFRYQPAEPIIYDPVVAFFNALTKIMLVILAVLFGLGVVFLLFIIAIAIVTSA